jgi:hypothetical protein
MTVINNAALRIERTIAAGDLDDNNVGLAIGEDGTVVLEVTLGREWWADLLVSSKSNNTERLDRELTRMVSSEERAKRRAAL